MENERFVDVCFEVSTFERLKLWRNHKVYVIEFEDHISQAEISLVRVLEIGTQARVAYLIDIESMFNRKILLSRSEDGEVFVIWSDLLGEPENPEFVRSNG